MPDALRRAQQIRGNRQHTGSGPDVEDAAAVQIDRLQRREAQAGRDVMAGAETHRREDDNRDGWRAEG